MARPNPLCEDAILSFLDRPLPVRVLEEVDSTNTFARALLAEGADTALICAERQTGGRGRQGKSFFSPRGAGLYMTLLLPVRMAVGGAVTVTTQAAVAVCRALEEMCGETFGIKWINDIYHDGKKTAGILAEAVAKDGIITHVILGVGVNVLPAPVPDELKDVMGHLPRPVDRNRLAAAIANNVLSGDNDMAYYRSRSLVLGRCVRYTWNGAWETARVLAVNDDGSLTVRHEDGRERVLNSGEISLRL